MKEQEYVRSFSKGQVLDESFNDFITKALLQVTDQRRDPDGFPHDIIIKFKKNIKVKVLIEIV